ncbi:MAG: radical SAM protein, partial [Thermodesulfobacteriota bacterium]|nr:radical SAM protein [Thermodesulfobacteriota bacterium]
MKTLLIFPPISDPRAPHLAQACLAAKLRSEGHEVHLWDLDLELSLKLLKPDFLQNVLEGCKEKMAVIDRKERKDYEDTSYWSRLNQTVRSMGHLPDNIPKALQILRSAAFYEREQFKWARKTINSALKLVSIAHNTHLNYQMDGQTFETGYRPDSLPDLKKAVLDDQANLFGPLYDQYVLPRITQMNPQFIGISILNYQQIIPGLTLSYRLMESGWPVYIGGTLLVKFIKEIKENPHFFDFCRGLIVYEGEAALTELLAALEKEEGFETVPNLLHPGENQSVIFNPLFMVEDLNNLPTPDFDGLPLEDYRAPQIVLPYNLGKGCYWDSCFFCEIPFINTEVSNAYRVKD